MRQESAASFASREISNGHCPEPATPSTARADQQSGGDMHEEDFHFPWAGEPFWQVEYLLKRNKLIVSSFIEWHVTFC